MKTKLILILSAVIIAISIFGYFIWYQNQQLRHEIAYLNKDFRQMYANMPDKDLIVTKSDFKRLMIKNNEWLQAITDSLDIKTRNITQTFDNHYHYRYDTTINVVKNEKYPNIRYFKYQPDSCIDVEGKFDLIKDSLYFDIFDVDYNSKTIYFWIRQTKNGKKIFWPFGRKVIFSQSFNNCKGDTKTEKITIEQKK